MKKIYVLLFITLLGSGVKAQNDTLLWENFNDTLAGFDHIVVGIFGDQVEDQQWLNVDWDGVNDANDRPQEWFLSLGFADQDSTNVVMASSSWLQGTVDGSDNWLVTPKIWIGDNQATLHWKSAPFQTPRYLDGYQVLVSTNGLWDYEFTDTLAVFAEFDGNNTTDIEDTTTYVFTDGIMHSSIEPDTADPTRNAGILQQWTRSLAAYEGQSIYIAFRHRSDDDNLLSVDDILVLGTGSVGTEELSSNEASISIFPNPASEKIQFNYYINNTAPVELEIISEDGKLVERVFRGASIKGNYQFTHDVSSYAAGNYFISLKAGNNITTQKFVVVK